MVATVTHMKNVLEDVQHSKWLFPGQKTTEYFSATGSWGKENPQTEYLELSDGLSSEEIISSQHFEPIEVQVEPSTNVIENAKPV